MAKTELEKEKKELKKTWQECFGVKMKEVLTEEGVEKFWDEETSIEEAEDMLTAAGISMYVSACLDEVHDLIPDAIGGIIIARKKEKVDESCDVKNDDPFKVERKIDRHVFSEDFETIDAAKEFIEKISLSSLFKVDDFRIIKVYE